MADQNTNKDILERVSELPDDLRKALFASATTEAIKEVGKKYGLMIDKIGELAQETGRVMLGITAPSEYVRNLAQRLELEQEKAKLIAEEINQKIFQPVRESLKKIHGIAGGDVKKPLPKREPARIATQSIAGGDIVAPPKPLPKPEISEPPSIPPIFVKKMPEPIVSKPDIIPPPKEPLAQNSLTAKNALEKELGAENIKPRTPLYKENDPYRELIEP